jgi:hypothetical protein
MARTLILGSFLTRLRPIRYGYGYTLPTPRFQTLPGDVLSEALLPCWRQSLATVRLYRAESRG